MGVRYKTYEVLKEETANPRTFWAYLPYSMHMAGPREAIHHMMIRKNFGCTHFIIGPDDGHAGRAVPEPGLHGRGGLRHGGGGQGEGALGPQTVGHEVPQDAPRRRGHPGVVRLQVRRGGAPPERLGVFYPSCIISSK